MRILVCMKAVPSSSEVEVDGQFRLKRDGAVLQWNIADQAALETALRLCGPDGQVCVLTMGPPSLSGLLRELLERGAHRAVLVSDPAMAGADTCATAAALAAAAGQLGPFDLILCGRRAMDGETGQVPGMLAQAMDLPCVTNVDRVALSDGGVELDRRMENGCATLSIPLPGVVSVCEYSLPLRLPGLLSRRRAKDIPVEVLDARQLGLDPDRCGLAGSPTRVCAMSAKFPGLRKGPRDSDPKVAAQRMLALLREVGV